jgi:Mlc titration factor MtfA (ptsG expression regulator)
MPIAAIIIIIVLLLALLATFYLFFLRKKATHRPFPDAWRKVLSGQVSFYQKLSSPERDRFEQAVLTFFEDVKVTGVEIEINDTDRLLVAASAVIPLFGFPAWRYYNLNEVLLYGDTFNSDYQTEGEERNVLGMVGSGAMNRIMILSLPALRRSFSAKAGSHHVGIHEFVHLLDKADGDTDGIPEMLLEKQYLIPWVKQMHLEMKHIRAGHSEINPYGATNEAEFLSVVSEYFFTQPEQLNHHHPELFHLLEQLFRNNTEAKIE